MTIARWSPGTGDEGGLAPTLAETHVSLLIFAGDRAYKLKKAVRTPFLDFSSPELRRAACEREVELNRRMAPDVYLGVADVLGPGGASCDHLVVMRRMPPERRLAHLVRTGAPVDRWLELIAEAVARFHARARTGPDVVAEGTRDAVAARWERNIAELEPFVPQLPDPGAHERIARLARTYLAGREPLFDRRIEEGRIRDGHGDLLADDVFCLDDGPRILDCLEFDDHLRYVDVLDDAAFLAMDLERLGDPALGQQFLAAYQRASGEDHPPSLADQYVAYRAHVRAKVACLRHEQGGPEALDEAGHLLRIAQAHLEAARVVLLLVGGPPGTGKSTLARALAQERGWALLRSDEVRKDLVGVPRLTHEPAGYGEGLYTTAVTDATYDALLRQARELLGQGTSAILDASWSSAERRSTARALAAECAAEFVALRCECSPDVAAARLAERARRGADPSDATPAVARSMREVFDPWPEAVAVDTSTGPDETQETARRALARLLSAELERAP